MQRKILAAAIFALFASMGIAHAASITSKVAVCDPANPLHCAIPDASGNLPVTGSGGGGGLSVTDQSAFTQGTSAFAPMGGVFNDAATLSSGQEGTVRLTTDRQMKVLDSAVLAAIQSPLAGVTTAQTSAAASSLVAKASAGSLVSVSGSAVSGSFIMVFNATSAPADGAVTPLKCFGPMSAAGPFTVAWGTGPVLTMSTGITVVSSSTGCFTKTATNAAFLSVEYQ